MGTRSWLSCCPQGLIKRSLDRSLEFVIDEKGAITSVRALDNKRATIEMQKAAEKAVQKVSKLTPAKQGGNPVRIKYSIPVSFKIK